jgi:hypothetical protein
MWKLLDYRGEKRKEGREMMVGQTYHRNNGDRRP